MASCAMPWEARTSFLSAGSYRFARLDSIIKVHLSI